MQVYVENISDRYVEKKNSSFFRRKKFSIFYSRYSVMYFIKPL